MFYESVIEMNNFFIDKSIYSISCMHKITYYINKDVIEYYMQRIMGYE